MLICTYNIRFHCTYKIRFHCTIRKIVKNILSEEENGDDHIKLIPSRYTHEKK